MKMGLLGIVQIELLSSLKDSLVPCFGVDSGGGARVTILLR
jgi:hypothetical protein